MWVPSETRPEAMSIGCIDSLKVASRKYLVKNSPKAPGARRSLAAIDPRNSASLAMALDRGPAASGNGAGQVVSDVPTDAGEVALFTGATMARNPSIPSTESIGSKGLKIAASVGDPPHEPSDCWLQLGFPQSAFPYDCDAPSRPIERLPVLTVPLHVSSELR